MANYESDYLFGQWLDNALTNEEREAFEALCLSDKAFAAQVETATQLSVAAEQFTPPPMPAWDKNATFVAPDKPKWWQWQGLPVMSMAMSALAIVLVVSGFSVQVSEGKLTMGFQQGPSDEQVAALVNQKLNDYQQANQANSYFQQRHESRNILYNLFIPIRSFAHSLFRI